VRVAIEILGSPILAFEYEKNSAKDPGSQCPLSADGSCGIAELIDDDEELTVVSNTAGQFELADLPTDDEEEDDDPEDRHGCACARRKKPARADGKPRFGF
jgi:hypothetical protein